MWTADDAIVGGVGRVGQGGIGAKGEVRVFLVFGGLNIVLAGQNLSLKLSGSFKGIVSGNDLPIQVFDLILTCRSGMSERLSTRSFRDLFSVLTVLGLISGTGIGLSGFSSSFFKGRISTIWVGRTFVGIGSSLMALDCFANGTVLFFGVSSILWMDGIGIGAAVLEIAPPPVVPIIFR